MKVGVIGLGTMGMGAALNLHRKGHEVIGCEPRDAARTEFIAAGAAAVASPAELPPEGLLGGMHRLAQIPAEIVQGRYDMICPACTAFELAAAWPTARLTIVPDAGHSALEPGVRRALVAAVERYRHGR